MEQETGPIIDMTPEGQFVDPPKPSLLQIGLRLLAFGVALCVGAALVWTAFILIPIFLVLGVAGYWLVRSQRGRGRVI